MFTFYKHSDRTEDYLSEMKHNISHKKLWCGFEYDYCETQLQKTHDLHSCPIYGKLLDTVHEDRYHVAECMPKLVDYCTLKLLKRTQEYKEVDIKTDDQKQ